VDITTTYNTNLDGSVTIETSETSSPQDTTFHSISYLPFTIRWDANWSDKYGSTDFGIGYSPNLWYSGGQSNIQAIAGSAQASGYWNVLTASLSRDQDIRGGWRMLLHADGQWASEPLISNEQYGLGGLSGVRGYHEGEVFGDDGWRFTSEVRTPSLNLGMVDATQPMYFRGSVFMDYGEVFHNDPKSLPARTPLWGTGLGFSLAIGQIIDGHIFVAWPLLSTPGIYKGETRFYLAISGQF
jgi:hemolysin activation/secretion protein